MNERALPPDATSPRDGDVVVTQESRPPVHYTVRQPPGIAQFSAPERDEAVRLARVIGQRCGVDVWYSEAGALRLLEAYRPEVRSIHGAPAADRLTSPGKTVERTR